MTRQSVHCTLSVGSERANKQRGGQDVAEVIPNAINDILNKRKMIRAFPFTYSQVAAVANVSRNTVWNLANGSYWPKLDTAYKISRALSTTVYEIWGEVEILRFLYELGEAEQERMMKRFADEISED